MTDLLTFELSKLRMLRFLSEPVPAQYGATMPRIKSMRFERLERISDAVLPVLLESGLIERRSDDGRSKPYFITEKGKQYLAENEYKLDDQTRKWQESVRQVEQSSQPLETAAALLRDLPEFRDSGEERILEVSRALVEAIGVPAPQMPRGDAGRSHR